MYVPEPFQPPSPEATIALIGERPFGLLIAILEGRPEAAHLPFLLARNEGPHGTLYCHVARANPIGRAALATAAVLCIFQGPHAYISPDWYAGADLVPTWNYVAVHAYGRARALEDGELAELLERLSAEHEAAIPAKRPWTVAKMAPETYAKMRRALLGLAIAVETVEGKWKLSQNRTAADVKGAAAALRTLGGEERMATAALMEATLARGRAR